MRRYAAADDNGSGVACAMSHWYRRPRANSVWSLLCRLQRSFLLDGCICDDARHIFLDGTRLCEKLAVCRETLRERVVQKCQRDQRILVTTDPGFEALLYQRADIPWGLLLLPNQHNEQIEILQQLSIGQLRFDSVNKPKFNINYASRNNFLVNLRRVREQSSSATAERQRIFSHSSVQTRMDARTGYRPKNLPQEYDFD